MGINIERRSDKGTMDGKVQMDIKTGFVWLVVRRDKDESGNPDGFWHIQGVASDEKGAVAMCVDETYFIGPLPVDTALPEKRIEWVGSYFPLKGD